MLCFIANGIHAQAGMYSEYDIDIQNKFLEAQIHKYTGDTEKQIETLKSVLKVIPDCDIAMFELSRIYFAQKDQEQAIKYGTNAYNTKSIEWYGLHLAEIYEDGQRFDQSEKIFSKLLMQNDDNLVFYHRLAFAQKLNGKADEAIETFNRLEAKQGINESTTRRKFEIYSNTNRPKEALKELQQLCQNNPKNTRYLNNLASYHDEIGNKNEAKEIYQKVLLLDPTNTTANIALIENPNKANDENYLNAITPLIENPSIPLDSKVKELIPFIAEMPADPEDLKNVALISNAKKLLNLYPKEAKAHTLIADIFYNLDKRTEAIDHYKKALDLNDNVFTIWQQSLKALYESAEYTQLSKYALNALDIYPNQFDCYFFRGLALARNKDRAGLDELLEEAKFVAANSEENKVKLAAIESSFYIQNGDGKKAMSSLEKFSLKEGSFPYVSEIIGDIYAINDQIEKATQFWDNAYKAGNRAIRLQEKIQKRAFIE